MRPPFTRPDSESHLLWCECPTRNFRAPCSLSYAQHVTAGITTTQAAPAGRIRSRNPSHHDAQISMEEALRMMDEVYQMQFYHQLRQLGSLRGVNTRIRGAKETMQDFAVILARLERHYRPTMDAQRMDEERQSMLWLREWLGLAEDPDELRLHKKAGLGGAVGDRGGGGSRGDSHRKRRQDKEKAKGKAQAEPRVKPKEKAKAMGLGKDRSDVWVERIRGDLCCVKKTREKKGR